jgi:hypothetical protein
MVAIIVDFVIVQPGDARVQAGAHLPGENPVAQLPGRADGGFVAGDLRQIAAGLPPPRFFLLRRHENSRMSV